MHIITDAQQVPVTLETFSFDSSYALVFLEQPHVSVPDLALVREAARVCDRVVASSREAIRRPELLKEAGVDVLLQLPADTEVELEVRKQPFARELQSILLVMPNVVLIQPEQVQLKAQLEALLNWSPGVTIVQEFKK